MTFFGTATILCICVLARKGSSPSYIGREKCQLPLHLYMLIRKHSADDWSNYNSMLGEPGALSVTRERHRSVCDNKGSYAYLYVIKAQSRGQSLVNELGKR